MKRIDLTQGKVALVNNCDYDYLSQWSWCFSNAGYAKRGLGDGTEILMHREIMLSAGFTFVQVDHIDGDKLNNCRRNLRPATASENLRNRGPQKNNTSGYKGVCFDKARGKWKSQIKINRQLINLGRFDTKEEAALSYNAAAKALHGKFAYLNEVAVGHNINGMVLPSDPAADQTRYWEARRGS